MFGSVVTLSTRAPGVDPAQTADFLVTEIAHLYVDMATLFGLQEGSCHNDVTCHSAWGTDANGVAGLGTIGGPAGVLWCTGALLNDYDPATFAGYFLTANHCLNGGSNSILGTQANANTIEYYWFYQTPACNGTPPNPATVPRTATGADLISRQTRDAGNDHAFMRIRGALPGGLTFLGWDTAPFSNGDDTTGIHHPNSCSSASALATSAGPTPISGR